MSKKTKHLYSQFQPTNYQLNLAIDKDTLSFKGKVLIAGQKVGRPAQRISLHQRDLKITSAKLVRVEKTSKIPISISKTYSHKAYDELRIHSNQILKSGDYEIEIEFNGKITEHMLGIYPSYFTHKDKKEVIIATQFESHYAREAFPCIDEPIAKATFDLTLTTKQGDEVIANTPTKSQSNKNGLVTTVFETTPKMSTYLLAFVTGPLHSIERKTKTGTIVRSWTAISRPKSQLKYSVYEAVKILEFFTDYFGVDYPLTKCDQVALPDFDAGAMENWGLITYREVALLSDPDNPSISSDQYISLVIAHELSHQWFGNLVTMKWWDDLWLNESFASLMEHVALDAIHPNWFQWECYTATDVLTTTSRDIFQDIQPVGVKVKDPVLIDTLFDPGIVYAKGGRLLKMLHDYIGDRAFRHGLQIYFKKHAYSNTSRNDLWLAMTEASGKDISSLMTPWIEKPGMPLISINQNKKQLICVQQRFLLDGKNHKSNWPIPLLANQKLSKDILTKHRAGFSLVSEELIIINLFGSGHYFTHYEDLDHKKFLAKQITDRSVPTETRINLLNDSYMLARGAKSSLVDSLELIANCSTEDRDNVWTLICRIIASASLLTEGNKQTEKAINSFKIKLAKYWYDQYGWTHKQNDDPNTKQLRHTAIALMIGGEDKTAINQAIKIYKQAKNLDEIDAEMRASILSAVIRHNNSKSDINKFIKLYPNVSSDIQSDLTSALSKVKNEETAQFILNLALGESGFVRSQDVIRWLNMFLHNKNTKEVTWNFITEQWDWLESIFSKSKSFDYIPTITASVMNTKVLQNKYIKFFEPKLSDKTLSQNINIGFSNISALLKWRKRDEEKIINFFKSQPKN